MAAKPYDVEVAALCKTLQKEDQRLLGTGDISPTHAPAPVQQEEKLTSSLHVRELRVKAYHQGRPAHITRHRCVATGRYPASLHYRGRPVRLSVRDADDEILF